MDPAKPAHRKPPSLVALRVHVGDAACEIANAHRDLANVCIDELNPGRRDRFQRALRSLERATAHVELMRREFLTDPTPT